MKNYVITVNGTSYDVTVDEVGADQAPVAAAPAPAAAPAKKAAPAPAAGKAGAVKITSPMPGKILSVKLSAGTAVKKGDVVLILEAMKMENEIVAPQDGVLASIDVAAGDAVEAGAVLASLN